MSAQFDGPMLLPTPPPLTDLDRITKGIRPIGDADTGGGVGSSIGPSN